jgi:ATP synthase protein I
MAANDEPQDDPAALRARMDALSRDIRARRPTPSAPAPSAGASNPGGMGAAMSMGLRAGSEFVAAILVGGAIGWGIDWLLHTKPAFTIVFFLLGVVAGVWNVIRATSPKAASFVANSPLSVAKPEDKDVPRGGPIRGDGHKD